MSFIVSEKGFQREYFSNRNGMKKKNSFYNLGIQKESFLDLLSGLILNSYSVL